MVPPSSHGIPRVPQYSGFRLVYSRFTYRILTFFDSASQLILFTFVHLLSVPTPGVFLLLVWPASLSLATTRKISVDFFSSSYLDVSVQTVPSVILFYSDNGS